MGITQLDPHTQTNLLLPAWKLLHWPAIAGGLTRRMWPMSSMSCGWIRPAVWGRCTTETTKPARRWWSGSATTGCCWSIDRGIRWTSTCLKATGGCGCRLLMIYSTPGVCLLPHQAAWRALEDSWERRFYPAQVTQPGVAKPHSTPLKRIQIQIDSPTSSGKSCQFLPGFFWVILFGLWNFNRDVNPINQELQPSQFWTQQTVPSFEYHDSGWSVDSKQSTSSSLTCRHPWSLQIGCDAGVWSIHWWTWAQHEVEKTGSQKAPWICPIRCSCEFHPTLDVLACHIINWLHIVVVANLFEWAFCEVKISLLCTCSSRHWSPDSAWTLLCFKEHSWFHIGHFFQFDQHNLVTPLFSHSLTMYKRNRYYITKNSNKHTRYHITNWLLYTVIPIYKHQQL